jgi:hypothetical protein
MRVAITSERDGDEDDEDDDNDAAGGAAAFAQRGADVAVAAATDASVPAAATAGL